MFTLFVSQKKRAKEEKKNQLAIKRTSENELCWEAVMIYQHGSQPAPPFLPIVPRKQIAIARYFLAQYSHRFPKLRRINSRVGTTYGTPPGTRARAFAIPTGEPTSRRATPKLPTFRLGWRQH